MLKITENSPGYFYKKMGKAGKKSRGTNWWVLLSHVPWQPGI
jgi:hypothetical protein